MLRTDLFDEWVYCLLSSCEITNVTLVSCHYYGNSCGQVCLYLFHPFAEIFEGECILQIIHNHST
jgi:hypothetical protein